MSGESKKIPHILKRIGDTTKMYKIFLLPLASIFLVGCGAAPVKPINKQCDSIGTYARNIVTLRDVGVPLSQINSNTSSAKYPFHSMNTDAYNLKTKNPSDAYIAFYQMCVSVGYDFMKDIFHKEDMLRKAKIAQTKETKQAVRYRTEKHKKYRKKYHPILTHFSRDEKRENSLIIKKYH